MRQSAAASVAYAPTRVSQRLCCEGCWGANPETGLTTGHDFEEIPRLATALTMALTVAKDHGRVHGVDATFCQRVASRKSCVTDCTPQVDSDRTHCPTLGAKCATRRKTDMFGRLNPIIEPTCRSVGEVVSERELCTSRRA